MLKKSIKYVDYNGNERQEDFYFNISKPELAEMQVNEEGGMEKRLNEIILAQDLKSSIDVFKKIILLAYGEKSEDGKRFVKSQELADAFVQSPAYEELFMELATNEDAAASFINGVIPNIE